MYNKRWRPTTSVIAKVDVTMLYDAEEVMECRGEKNNVIAFHRASRWDSQHVRQIL
jgi:hypothetical protein